MSIVDRMGRVKKLQPLTRLYYAYRDRPRFDGVEKFCLFIGYPRSGHTLVGAFIDAHPEAVLSLGGDLPTLLEKGLSRDRIYALLLERSRMRGRKSQDRFRVDEQWQGGRFRKLRIIGHKRAGEAARTFAAKLELLDQLRRTVGVPLKVVHTVRNPYDNITTISRKHGMSLPDAVDYYFYMCAAVRVLKAHLNGDEMVTLRHEDIIADPKAEIRRLFEFLSLETDEQFIVGCAGIVFEKPHQSRHLLNWTTELRDVVAKRIEEYPDLSGYRFDG